jgi:tRNA-2-methylthio-N6-dimethylallyladenosine synthase
MRFRNSYEEKIKKYVVENKLTYNIDTMGCQMNENDSNKYMGILESMGFKRENSDKANLILFNTCCVRENAENTLFGRLGFLKTRKMNEKNVYIVVVGCMTQQKHILEKIKKSYRFTDIVLGTNSMNIFPQKLYEAIVENKKAFEYIEENNDVIEDIPIIYEDN